MNTSSRAALELRARPRTLCFQLGAAPLRLDERARRLQHDEV
jgi:hypothetical protein